MRVTAPVGYGADGSITHGTVEMTTPAQGCFLIEQGDSDSPGAWDGGCAWAPAGTALSRGRKTFLSPAASSVALNAPGYAPDPKTNATLMTAHRHQHLHAGARARRARHRAAGPRPGGAGRPDVRLVPGPPSRGQTDRRPTNADQRHGEGTGTRVPLSWTDSRLGVADGVVTPGHYEITATRAGYLPDAPWR